jgi:hypothetical protein
MMPSAKQSIEMKQNTNNVTYFQLSLYVSPYVNIPSVAQDIFDMYDISDNLGEKVCAIEYESSQFRT